MVPETVSSQSTFLWEASGIYVKQHEASSNSFQQDSLHWANTCLLASIHIPRKTFSCPGTSQIGYDCSQWEAKFSTWLFILKHFDHISSYLVLEWDIVSTECSFAPVLFWFILNVNLKVSFCVYVDRVAEARNPQKQDQCFYKSLKEVCLQKSEQDFYFKAISSAVPSNIVAWLCCLQIL